MEIAELLKYTGFIGLAAGLATVIVGAFVADKSFSKLVTLSESSLYDKDTKQVVLIGMIFTGILIPITTYQLNTYLSPEKTEDFVYISIVAGVFSAITPILIATGYYKQHLFTAGIYAFTTFIYQFMIVSYLHSYAHSLTQLLLGIAVIDLVAYILGVILFSKKGIIFELSFALFTGLFMLLVNIIYLYEY
ncbi:hypothetical protein GF389_01590 [Candidatus Dojkabacteria bacterium]|nr:hypothetical protein [Candidatus Dojkabacteria bacterium]